MSKGKCANCGAKLITTYTKDGFRVLICPHIQTHIVKSGIGNLKHAELYCQVQQVRLWKRDIKFFKQELISKLVEKPLPKEDYKRIEKAIKKLEQADVNDILYNLKSEEENLKRQIEIALRASVDVSVYLKNAYELYTFAFILRKLGDRVGLEVSWPKDQRELVKDVVKATLK
jgi:hypothetical protein